MTGASSPSIEAMIALRRELHRNPELSGEEEQTAARVVSELTRFQPDDILTGLGGHGVAAVFKGAEDGPTILFRLRILHGGSVQLRNPLFSALVLAISAAASINSV